MKERWRRADAGLWAGFAGQMLGRCRVTEKAHCMGCPSQRLLVFVAGRCVPPNARDARPRVFALKPSFLRMKANGLSRFPRRAVIPGTERATADW